MLNQNLSRVDSFANQNSVLVDTSWNTYETKSTLWKVVSFYKQEADSILTEQQVHEWYYISVKRWLTKISPDLIKQIARKYTNKLDISDVEWFDIITKQNIFYQNQIRQCNMFNYIEEKQNVIEENKEKILSWIRLSWKVIWYSKLLFTSYLDNWYISINDIKRSIISYFWKEAEKAHTLAHTPLNASIYNWEPFIVQDYHDIDHDLQTDKKLILAYALKHNLLLSAEIEGIEKILSKWWDDLEYFYKIYYKEGLINTYLENLNL